MGPGTVIGPYRIEAEIGSGGMGTVYSAVGPEGRVALKVLDARLGRSPEARARFAREGDLGRAVRHENVVRALDSGASPVDGEVRPWLAMEHVDGRTVRSVLADLGRIPEELCRHVGRDVAQGLAAIHAAGAVHRDLKPENVILTPSHVVKVMDLGVARLVDEAVRLSGSGVFVGSVPYAAPEQFRGGGTDVDARADLHALGVLLYEMASGTHPFPGDDVAAVLRRILDEEPRRLSEIAPQVSPFLEEVVHTLLQKDRDRRFPSASAAARALEEGEEGAWWAERARAIRARTRRPLRRTRVAHETALVGREAEIGVLVESYERALAGKGAVVLVEGEAGIGKTRLVDGFLERLEREGADADVLLGTYPPAGAATASGAFSAAFRERFGPDGLEGALREVLPATPLLAPAFAALLPGDATPAGAEPLTKGSLQACFVQATRSLAARQPAILVIEDLQWAPEDGRSLFAALAQAVPGHRILLVGTARPPVDARWVSALQRLDGFARVPVPRLGARDVVGLLRDALRSETLARDLAGRVAEKTDGNPFFVLEVLRRLREDGALARGPDGTWHTTRVLREILVPSSVDDLVAARVCDLDARDRNLLEAASCLGFEFDPLRVGEVLGVAPIPLLQRLGSIEKTLRLVRSIGRRFAFDHHRVQEVLYAGVSPLLRERYHAAFAEALEREASSVGPPDPGLAVEICHHVLAGGLAARARRWLGPALDHLERVFAQERAADLAGRALAAEGVLAGAARVEILLRRAARLDLLGRRPEQEEALAEAAALVVTLDPDARRRFEARVESAMGTLHSGRSEFREARTRHERALSLARESGDVDAETTAWLNLGRVASSEGRYDEARGHYETALATAERSGNRTAQAGAIGNLGTTLHAQGRLAEARGHFERHMSLAREAGDRRGEAMAAGNLGSVAWQSGRIDEAKALYERHLAIVRAIGDRRGEALGALYLGLLALDSGELAEADTRFHEAAEIARETGDRATEATAHGDLGVAAANTGRIGDARDHYERQLGLAREIGDRTGEGWALLNGALLRLECGRLEEAEALLSECLAVARTTGVRRQEGCAKAARARLLTYRDDLPGAEQAYRDAAAELQAADARREALSARMRLAEVLSGLGRAAAARDLLRTVVEESAAVKSEEVRVLAAAMLGALPGESTGPARDLLAGLASALPPSGLLEARWLLFLADGRQEDLEEAKRLAARVLDGVPPEWISDMGARVPLFRDVLGAG